MYFAPACGLTGEPQRPQRRQRPNDVVITHERIHETTEAAAQNAEVRRLDATSARHGLGANCLQRHIVGPVLV